MFWADLKQQCCFVFLVVKLYRCCLTLLFILNPVVACGRSEEERLDTKAHADLKLNDTEAVDVFGLAARRPPVSPP